MNYKAYLCMSLSLITTQWCSAETFQKKAIIIGASTGIGNALAKELIKHNYVVAVTSRRIHLLDELEAAFPANVITRYMDVEQVDASRATLSELLTTMGTVDIFIFNAATWPAGPQDLTPSGDISWLCLQRMAEVNINGFIGLTDIALQQFKKQGHGHLVGISSVDAMRGSSSGPMYCATKSFMATYLEGLRNTFIQNNIPIDVTEVRPGYIQTSYEMSPAAYWVSTPEVIAPQIVESIHNKDKVAYVTRRWKLIGLLLTIVPDWVYNKIGGF